MVDQSMIPAIREAIKQNELGNASPYCLSFACLGASGASFGIFQGDTNVDHDARATLLKALQAKAADVATQNRIIAAVSRACPGGNPLTKDDTETANSALSCDQGIALVDRMDGRLLDVVLSELDSCISAAASRQQSLASAVQLYVALWVNMTGAPDTLNKWLGGTQELGLMPPLGPVVTKNDIEKYLQANTYFRVHPKNFVHMRDAVATAMPFLPGTVSVAA
ncbi:MAG TPA: hypothetical protein VK558_05460 [Patescibacteria group bacterium]|nr:hypothetical protein [Patescibacteria group bacterium]